MISLIKKDIRIVRWGLILFLAMIVLTAPELLLSRNDMDFYILFIFGNMLLTTAICNTEMMIENKSKTDIFITSLPIDRKNIVKSKYIAFGIFPLVSNLIHYLVVSFANKHSFLAEIGNIQNGIHPSTMFVSLSICLIYIFIYLPLNYFLEEKSKIIEYIMLLSMFLIPELFAISSKDANNIFFMEKILSIGRGNIALIFLLIALITGFISYRISVAIYNKREF